MQHTRQAWFHCRTGTAPVLDVHLAGKSPLHRMLLLSCSSSTVRDWLPCVDNVRTYSILDAHTGNRRVCEATLPAKRCACTPRHDESPTHERVSPLLPQSCSLWLVSPLASAIVGDNTTANPGPHAGVQPCREMRSCAGEYDTTLCQIRAGRRQVSPLERQHRPQPSRVCGRAAGLKGLSGPMGGHFHMRTRNDMMTGAGETHEAMLRTGCAWDAPRACRFQR